ncbi:MAG TPA: hypothetical protein VER14_00300 [Phototrophicaceae bacterium]|nr:hypothetical protein [Phototrophicaceae bacterium]
MNRKIPEIKLKTKTNLDNLNINMLSSISKIKESSKYFVTNASAI